MNTVGLLAHFPKMTSKRYGEVTGAFGSPDAFFHATASEIRTRLPWKPELITSFLLWRDKIDQKRIEKIFRQEHIEVITPEDTTYPALLKHIYDPPFCLFVRGTLLSDADYPLAVVGTRKATPYGIQMTEELVGELAAHGLTIVSGLALGIDGIAHRHTLKSKGKTLAVLGSGINAQHIYPASHRQLADALIAAGGALISEYPPGALPSPYTFPRRNRIIAGMSLGTLVVEAAKKSGALITASCALEYGREVFSIPHPLTSKTGEGPNQLLKEGAHMITSAKDIMEILHLDKIKTFTQAKEIVPDSTEEAALLNYLSREPIHIDELVLESGLTSDVVNSTLTLMEMKGKIRNIGNMHYVLSR